MRFADWIVYRCSSAVNLGCNDLRCTRLFTFTAYSIPIRIISLLAFPEQTADDERQRPAHISDVKTVFMSSLMRDSNLGNFRI